VIEKHGAEEAGEIIFEADDSGKKMLMSHSGRIMDVHFDDITLYREGWLLWTSGG
jgi:hypothetical protein